MAAQGFGTCGIGDEIGFADADSAYLEWLEKRVDDLDDQIVDLLDARASLAGDLARAKRTRGVALHDPEREDALVERLSSRARRFPQQRLAVVFDEIISACLALCDSAERSDS